MLADLNADGPVGRFLSMDPLPGSFSPNHPQSENRYSYCANNPALFVDPTGQILMLGGGQYARDWEFSELQESLDDATLAHQLVTLTSNGHTIVVITGDAEAFANSSFVAQNVANAINSTATITLYFGLNTFNEGPRYPAYTAPVDEHYKLKEGSRNSLISIDPRGLPTMSSQPGGYYENLRSTIQHELGHALGIANGTYAGRGAFTADSGTNPEAIIAENRARQWYMSQAAIVYGPDSAAAKAAERIWRDRPHHGL